MTGRRKTYRVDILPPDRSHPGMPEAPREWIRQTRVNTKAQAEGQAALWRARHFDVRIVEEP